MSENPGTTIVGWHLRWTADSSVPEGSVLPGKLMTWPDWVAYEEALGQRWTAPPYAKPLLTDVWGSCLVAQAQWYRLSERGLTWVEQSSVRRTSKRPSDSVAGQRQQAAIALLRLAESPIEFHDVTGGWTHPDSCSRGFGRAIPAWMWEITWLAQRLSADEFDPPAHFHRQADGVAGCDRSFVETVHWLKAHRYLETTPEGIWVKRPFGDGSVVGFVPPGCAKGLACEMFWWTQEKSGSSEGVVVPALAAHATETSPAESGSEQLQSGSSKALGRRTKDELAPKQRHVVEFLESARGPRTGPVILAALFKRGISIDDAYFRGRMIPKLREYGWNIIRTCKGYLLETSNVNG